MFRRPSWEFNSVVRLVKEATRRVLLTGFPSLSNVKLVRALGRTLVHLQSPRTRSRVPPLHCLYTRRD